MTEFQFMRRFGFNLKITMDEVGVKQSTLSKRTGIDRSTISRYVNGEVMPSLKNVVNIAIVLDCELTDLIDDGEMIE